ADLCSFCAQLHLTPTHSSLFQPRFARNTNFGLMSVSFSNRRHGHSETASRTSNSERFVTHFCFLLIQCDEDPIRLFTSAWPPRYRAVPRRSLLRAVT